MSPLALYFGAKTTRTSATSLTCAEFRLSSSQIKRESNSIPRPEVPWQNKRLVLQRVGFLLLASCEGHFLSIWLGFIHLR